MENQQYNKTIESLANNIVKVVKTFVIFPILLMLLTPMGYLASLGTTILTLTIFNTIKRYVGKR